MNNKSHTTHLRKEVMVRVIQAFLTDNFEQSTGRIPYDMRPKNAPVPYRCCIHKERAILRTRTIASLGYSVELDDEATPLSEYAKRATERKIPENRLALTVIDSACKACTPSRVFVTDLCQGCVARPCEGSCHFGAISIKDGKSVIDAQKCKNCTKCIQMCPYNAIVKLVVPCENSCPVDAIKKNDTGFAEIDKEKCISCGACVLSCPFGAVAEKSQMIDILKAIKSDKKVVAMIAPSVAGQLPVTVQQLATGLVQAGFDEVYEVAQGADLTAEHEAQDFEERMARGDDFMTTSCCAAYNELVKKHVPDLKPFVSETRTPMHYTAKMVKDIDINTVTVFIGPCVAKRREGFKDSSVDYVMSFEEMGALFIARHIQVAECEAYEFSAPASRQGRNFALSGGVAKAVEHTYNGNVELKPYHVNSLNKKSIRELKSFASKKECTCGNLIEVMACEGGCIGGSAVISEKKFASKKVQEYSQQGADLK